MEGSKLYKSLDISKKTVLVTGATAGIGYAIAQRYAELGCQLVLLGRREERLKQLAQWIAENFPQTPAPELVVIDLQDTQKIKDLPKTLKNPNVDILINNAGMALGVTAVDTNDLEDTFKVLQTNVMAVISTCAVFTPGMKQRNFGHVVNISSVAATDGYEGGSVYCASKFAVNGFSIASRFDLVGTPLRVTTISPGLVETEFSQVRFGGDTEKAKTVYQDIVPLSADDIADQVIYTTTRPSNVQIADIKSYCTNQAHAKYSVHRVGESLGAK